MNVHWITIPSLVIASVMAARPAPTGPTADSPEYSYPAIAKYGKVVQLPKAAQQPRDGSRIVVDVTKGGPADALNPAIEKAARFVNIYAGAGSKAATADIVLVLHGEATLTILHNEAYAARFHTDGNPNLDCLRELHKAGVKVFVCGQSLTGKGAKPSEVADVSGVAVSALTSLVNLQADGYAYVPLGG